MYNTLLSSNHFKTNFELARYEGEVNELSKFENDLYKSPNYKESTIIMIASFFYEDDIIHIEQLVSNLLQGNKTVVLVKEPYHYKMINSKTMVDVAIQDYIEKQNDNFDSIKDSLIVNEINRDSYYNRIIDSDLLKIQADSIIDKIKTNNPQVIILDRNDYICNQELHSCFVIDFKFQKFNYDSHHTTIEGATFFGKRIDEIQWLSPVIKSLKK